MKWKPEEEEILINRKMKRQGQAKIRRDTQKEISESFDRADVKGNRKIRRMVSRRLTNGSVDIDDIFGDGKEEND